MTDDVQRDSNLNLIDALVQQLRTQIQTILGKKLVGVYLGGSVANTCFNTDTSDIDCYIVTSLSLSKKEISDIELMHKRLFLEPIPFAKKIEASYLSSEDIEQFNPKNTRPYFNEGNFYLAPYGHNFIIELALLRDKGIAIFGPDIKQLIPPITSDNLKDAIKKNLDEYWRLIIEDDSKMSRSDYQAFAILTMCRTLYSLETGLIISKTAAAQWTMQHVDNHYKRAIKKVMYWKPDQELHLSNEAKAFVKDLLRLTY